MFRIRERGVRRTSKMRIKKFITFKSKKYQIQKKVTVLCIPKGCPDLRIIQIYWESEET